MPTSFFCPFLTLSLCVFAVFAPFVQAEPTLLHEELAKALQRTAPVASNDPIPVVDFLRPPRLSRLKLNPSGTAYAARVSSTEDLNDLYVYHFDQNKSYGTKALMSEGSPYEVTDYYWLDDENLFYRVGRKGKASGGMLSANFTAFDSPRVVSQYGGCTWLGQPATELNHPYIWLRREGIDGDMVLDGRLVQVDPFRCSAPKRTSSLYAAILREFEAPPKETPIHYLTDNLGEIRFSITADDGDRSLWYLGNNGRWNRSPFNPLKWNIRGPGNNPNELTAVPLDKPGEASRLVFIDVRTGKETGTLHQDALFSLTRASLIRAGTSRRIVGLEYDRNLPFIKWLDAEYEALHDTLRDMFKGMFVRFESISRDEQTLIVSVYNEKLPVRYYQLKRAGLQLRPITASRPWLDPSRMSPMKRLTFTTRDGLDMEAYVTLPQGASPEHPVPLVVMPHGQINSRDTFTWHPAAQLLASRGYAVLQPNYRGSQGYLLSVSMDDPNFYRQMHEDVTDAVKALLATRVVDKNRIAIMGSGFGSYLVLCGAIYEPTLYRCAVTRARLFDWEFVANESKQHEDNDGRFHFSRNSYGSDRKMLERISPLKNVSSIQIPIFVAHGEEKSLAYLAQTNAARQGFGHAIVFVDEGATFISESKRLLNLLGRLKIPHEKLIEAGESHSRELLVQRVTLCNAILAFLDRNLAPVPAK